MTEIKQGLDVLFKWKAGAVSGFTDFEPDTAVDPDLTFTYKRDIDFNWNDNIEAIHDSVGRVTHHKSRIAEGNMSLSAMFTDDTEFVTLRDRVAGSSVPWGYAELQFLGVDGAVEFVAKLRRVTFNGKSNSDPREDSTVSPEFILYEEPDYALGASKKLN